MNNIESKIYLETKLRNLKRKHTRLAQYANLTDEYFNVTNEIKDVQSQLFSLQRKIDLTSGE